MRINSKEHKEELINFIMWKMRNDTPEQRAETLKQLKKKSFRDLREWAIRNDFID